MVSDLMKGKIMYKHFLLLAVLISSIAHAGYETGSANQVLRVPAAGGRPQYGQVDLSQSAAVKNQLPTTNGGTGQNSTATFPASGTVAVTANVPDLATEITNLGISASVASNQLTVALKGKNGSDPSASNIVNVGFRNSTAATGTYTRGSFTAATSITLAATDSIGVVAAATSTLNVYLVSDTTSEICLSSSLFEEGSLQNASALTGGADTSSTVLWCTSAHTGKPVRKIGRVVAVWSGAIWNTPTEVALTTVGESSMRAHIRIDTFNSTSTQFGSTDTGTFRYTNVRENTGTAFTHATSAANGSTVTINETGLYCAAASYTDSGNQQNSTSITKNSTQKNNYVPGAALETVCINFIYVTSGRGMSHCSGCFSAVPGDVIRHQGAGATDQNNPIVSFLDIIKMEN